MTKDQVIDEVHVDGWKNEVWMRDISDDCGGAEELCLSRPLSRSGIEKEGKWGVKVREERASYIPPEPPDHCQEPPLVSRRPR